MNNIIFLHRQKHLLHALFCCFYFWLSGSRTSYFLNPGGDYLTSSARILGMFTTTTDEYRLSICKSFLNPLFLNSR